MYKKKLNKTYSGKVCAMKISNFHLSKELKKMYKIIVNEYKHLLKLKVGKYDFSATDTLFQTLLIDLRLKLAVLEIFNNYGK